MMDNCCTCNGILCNFLITRQIVGFAEYVTTHDTDNPFTYFWGRAYLAAGVTITASAPVPTGLFTGSSSLSALVGVPSASCSSSGSESGSCPGDSDSSPDVFDVDGYNHDIVCAQPPNTEVSSISPTHVNYQCQNSDGTVIAPILDASLSSEVDYNAVIDSITGIVAAIKTYAGALPWTSCNLNVTFNDAPTPFFGGTSGIDYSGYDGSLQYGTGGLPEFGSTSAPQSFAYFSLDFNPAAVIMGCSSVVQFSAFTGLPTSPPATAPYILATFIIMNDFSLLIDTYSGGSGCVDGTTLGNFYIDIPSCKDLPTELYSTDDDALSGPIGRVTFLILGTTCATWDGTLPP